ncbi:glycosyltransferase family 2 protein [Marivita sp. GX14005]|uniref:glycosyltransferase family 2 protein n=1 Tax=Marivita sp. GX14005 TaxID=2942276 RepID=UPI00201979F2|nr:glycosyltransferase family 2 protein [Marivita sp. GX14005]MCL3881736.1 glycosyltransferase [Marivita sp. GX14005]
MKIAICACTFNRPDGLAQLLRSIRAIETRPDMDIRLIIVDNDDTPSAYGVFAVETRDYPFACRYVHETVPGIPAARNRVLDEVGSEGFAVFIDDDEVVSPRWVLELVQVAERTGATFVQGPVEMRVEDERDQWWLQTLFFLQRRFSDGEGRSESWTNNVLVDLKELNRLGCRFDEGLSFYGGEDTLFFQDIIRAGGRGAYAANAWVYEIQQTNRLTWRWAVSRQFRCGTTRAMTVLMRRPKAQSVVYCVVRGSGMVLVGLGWLASSILQGRRGFANGIAMLSRAAGVLSGLVGGRGRLEYMR